MALALINAIDFVCVSTRLLDGLNMAYATILTETK